MEAPLIQGARLDRQDMGPAYFRTLFPYTNEVYIPGTGQRFGAAPK